MAQLETNPIEETISVIKELNRKLTSLDSFIEYQKTENNSIKTTISDLKQDISDLKETINSLSKENDFNKLTQQHHNYFNAFHNILHPDFT